jgi:hypothetical protein
MAEKALVCKTNYELSLLLNEFDDENITKLVFLLLMGCLGPKTLDRRPCTGRSQEAVVIFLFGLEALLTRDSRVLSYAVSSSPKL